MTDLKKKKNKLKYSNFIFYGQKKRWKIQNYTALINCTANFFSKFGFMRGIIVFYKKILKLHVV